MSVKLQGIENLLPFCERRCEGRDVQNERIIFLINISTSGGDFFAIFLIKYLRLLLYAAVNM